MKPGRELDILVHEKVMNQKSNLLEKVEGLTAHEETTRKILNIQYLKEIPWYSTSIADAWLIVKKLKNFDYKLEKQYDIVNNEHYRRFSFMRPFSNESIVNFYEDDELPHAICLAALNALGVKA